eukprot:CAMPEP_0119148878 /NCGR_PEP_ID=MMETSP1310-20130426/42526_1 /TAXON_ID=464262 /ORGANISM="Genus nov. species nov., Strain RCC2339" /LENGTH=266 /DNA_ID=CAMNT_0007140943 /DNA_START=219 /DNA_END=1015 /DNA_ORIENTATION=-
MTDSPLEPNCQRMLEEFTATGTLFMPSFVDTSVCHMDTWANEVSSLGDVTYEKGRVTRCENFIHKHDGWRALVGGRMAGVCGRLFGEEKPAVLFKEKLNFKPPGGMGFAPHLDHPSLAFYAPETYDRFITVMVAIDDMTSANGCLRLVKGKWDAQNCVECIPPNGDPEVGGRAGGIAESALETLAFEDVEAKAGDVLFFHGYVPHRSGSNCTLGYRRALFITFNPASQGSYREQYYANLQRIRDEWLVKLQQEMEDDYQNDLLALA